MVRVGTRVRFVPPYMVKEDNKTRRDLQYAVRNEPVEGRVFKVNRKGVFFVEFVVGGVTLRVGFLMVDIGRKVKIIKDRR